MLSRLRQSTDRRDKGFTLIELLVVMIIIGILAAIAIPVFLNQRTRAYESAVKSDLRTAATQVETAYVDNQAYPADNTAFQGLITGQTSTGVTLVYTLASGGASYCIKGTHANTGGATGTNYAYKSGSGGLQARNAAGNSTCP